MADDPSKEMQDLEFRVAFQERNNEKLKQELLDMERRLTSAEGRIASLIQQLNTGSGEQGTDAL
ncbi:MAG: hypothetical protein DSY81_00575 [Bacillota bacterium]|nr:MAG: hypothetical protein DSY92_06435 [Planctomycetota bacterium]RUA11500.1 MAG: hypothetical protein DSY81_00575 [Bacillota bacterium]